MPIHFRLSIELKPDMLVLALSLSTLLLSSLALDRGGWRWFLAAGGAAGLAMSAKLTGGATAVPLAVGALWRSRREHRQLLRLTMAGTAAVVVFALTNPEQLRYMRRLFGIVRAYSDRPDRRPGSGFAGELLLWLLSPSGHGPILGVLALAGFGGMVAMLVVPTWRARLPFSYGPVAVGFPLAFVGIYRLLSDYFKPNNFLPALPFTALGASWLLVEGWVWLQDRLPRGRRPLAIAAGTAVVVVASLPLSAIVANAIFRSVVDVAIRRVESSTARSAAPAAVVVEGATGRVAPRRATIRRVGDLLTVPAATLACSDAEIFAARRLLEPTAGRYRERLGGGRPIRVTASLRDLVRGEDVLVVLHPRRLRGRRDLTPAAGQSYEIALPGAMAAGTCVSVVFSINRTTIALPRIFLDGTELPLRAARLHGRRLRTTDRIPVTLAPQRLTVVMPDGPRSRRGLRLQLLTW